MKERDLNETELILWQKLDLQSTDGQREATCNVAAWLSLKTLFLQNRHITSLN